MPKSAFEPCIRTRGTKVPDRPEWLIVQRDGMRVRLFTRNGHDWSDRFPLISEAALRNRTSSSFVIDGEAVLRALKAGAPDGRGPGDGGDLVATSTSAREGRDLRRWLSMCSGPSVRTGSS